MQAATQTRIKKLLREFMEAWIAKQYEELRRIEEQDRLIEARPRQAHGEEHGARGDDRRDIDARADR